MNPTDGSGGARGGGSNGIGRAAGKGFKEDGVRTLAVGRGRVTRKGFLSIKRSS